MTYIQYPYKTIRTEHL